VVEWKPAAFSPLVRARGRLRGVIARGALLVLLVAEVAVEGADAAVGLACSDRSSLSPAPPRCLADR
jgi:hypothetical protein